MQEYLSPNDPRFMGATDSESIQNAVNAAEKGPIRTVRIPRVCERTGATEWIIEKAILLPSDITIILDDCHLTLKKDIYENIFRNKNLYTDIQNKPEGKQKGIRIIGMGDAILDGGEGNDLRESTSMKDGRPSIRNNNFVLLHNVDDYVLENFSFINLRWWAINQVCCTNGRLENLRFFNGDRLPVGIRVVKAVFYEIETARYTVDEAMDIAYHRLREIMESELSESELIRKTVEYEITDSAYILYCRVECIEDIAVMQEFELAS